MIRGRLGKRQYLEGAREVRRRIRRGELRRDPCPLRPDGRRRVDATARPVVTTFHGSDTGYVRWQGWVSRVVARISTPIFVSQSGASRLGLPGADVIACGVDLDLFRPVDQAEARQVLGWKIDAPVALLPGARANPVKGAELFDAAVREARVRMPRAREPNARRSFRGLVSPCSLNAASVTVMTSHSEGSPVTIKESLACGTPVVSVAVGDIPALISGLPGCAVTERDPKAVASAILTALEARQPAALRERVEPYSRRRAAEQVLAVYERIARA